MADGGAEAMIRPIGRPGDLGWVVKAHGEVYATEFGWEAAWIAEVDGRRVGCVFCVTDDETTAKLRILLVHPDGRGHGLGGRLVDACVDFARAAGYARMRLWTNDPLVAARHVYLTRGFSLIAEEPHHSFGADLVGQTYELDLGRAAQLRRAARP
jgi:GNAT superfamily N-acetyltransferase